MLSGLYKLLDQPVIIQVKETEKSFLFQLMNCSRRFLNPPLDDFFKKDKVKIVKPGGTHAIRVWSDGSFTLYPFRVGVPFVFNQYKGA